MKKLYPESKVEITGLLARYYDIGLDIATFGRYRLFMQRAISLMQIKPEDRILDLGAGTGRNACLMAEYLSGKGCITGLDIGKEMIAQFRKRCAGFSNIVIKYQRIDQVLPYKDEFDIVFISFVLHGFPPAIRQVIMNNAFTASKENGRFVILDYNEFCLADLPFTMRTGFRLLECPYAFDFIKTDLQQLLRRVGFVDFREHTFWDGFFRLLQAVKSPHEK